jgi:SAM-dependent methyltransferase
MTISDLARRSPSPLPWGEGSKIPWNEPAFSSRMLAEHLSQAHDHASRRISIIERQAGWIHDRALNGRPGRILDLGCGPGLYAEPLVRRGHSYLGVDFSPASIAHARANAVPGAAYTEGDVRSADLGGGHSAAMMLYGELNVFTSADAGLILERAAAALEADGILILEVHTFDCVRRRGTEPPSWHAAPRGLFGDRPYLCVTEEHWHEEAAAAVTRMYVVEEGSLQVAFYTESIQAYTEGQYERLVGAAGFADVRFHPSLAGAERGDGDFIAVTARKAARGRQPR